MELKIAALSSLTQGSSAPSLSAEETIQHIAMGMLLCSFEVHQSSCTSGQWTHYLAGVKTLIEVSFVEALVEMDSDVVVLLDWVHYHDVLAGFSQLHHKKEGTMGLRWTPIELFSQEVRIA